jgi:hypothetical protein
VILQLSHWVIVRTSRTFSIAQSAITQSPNLFHFFMGGVLTATAAEFFKLQPLGRRLAVLGRRIIPLFAITAL